MKRHLYPLLKGKGGNAPVLRRPYRGAQSQALKNYVAVHM